MYMAVEYILILTVYYCARLFIVNSVRTCMRTLLYS